MHIYSFHRHHRFHKHVGGWFGQEMESCASGAERLSGGKDLASKSHRQGAVSGPNINPEGKINKLMCFDFVFCLLGFFSFCFLLFPLVALPQLMLPCVDLWRLAGSQQERNTNDNGQIWLKRKPT